MCTQAGDPFYCVRVVYCRGGNEDNRDRMLLFADANTLLKKRGGHICFTVALPK